MNAFVYMISRRIKNNILTLRREPAKLVLIALFVFLLITSVGTADLSEGELITRPIEELYAIVTLVYTALFALCSYSGFGTGASMFTMPDVMMLFPSPLRPKLILIYGLVRQLGVAGMICFFMIYQYSWLHQLYGITPPQLVTVLLCFIAVIFASQLLAMLIYSKTSADDNKKRLGKIIFFSALLIPVSALGIYVYLRGGNMLSTAVELLSGTVGSVYPFSGWAKGIAVGLMSGEYLTALLWMLPLLAAVGVMIFAISKMNTDFYEDVLAATEVAQSAITAKKENGGMNQYVKKNVKVGKIGIGRGKGASAIYYKLRVENRRARFFIIDTMSFIFLIITFGFAFIMRLSMGEEVDSTELADIVMVSTLAMSLYMQMFSTAMGSFAKELRLPYIYMIPQSAFKKLVFCICESVPAFLAEGLMLWLPMLIIFELPLLGTLFCILLRVAGGLFFVSIDVFCERFFGGMPKMIRTAIYFIGSVILLLPTVLGGVFGGIAAVSAEVGFAIALVVTLAISALVLFASRNMLDCAEVN